MKGGWEGTPEELSRGTRGEGDERRRRGGEDERRRRG